MVRDLLAAGDFWGGAGSVACRQFITQLGRNFQVIYEQANARGQKVQTAGSNMAGTDSTVGSSWAWPRIGSQQHTAIRCVPVAVSERLRNGRHHP
jgi:hypothetical protein